MFLALRTTIVVMIVRVMVVLPYPTSDETLICKTLNVSNGKNWVDINGEYSLMCVADTLAYKYYNPIYTWPYYIWWDNIYGSWTFDVLTIGEDKFENNKIYGWSTGSNVIDPSTMNSIWKMIIGIGRDEKGRLISDGGDSDPDLRIECLEFSQIPSKSVAPIFNGNSTCDCLASTLAGILCDSYNNSCALNTCHSNCDSMQMHNDSNSTCTPPIIDAPNVPCKCLNPNPTSSSKMIGSSKMTTPTITSSSKMIASPTGSVMFIFVIGLVKLYV